MLVCEDEPPPPTLLPSPIIFMDWLLWSTSLLSILFKPKDSRPGYCSLGFLVNIRFRKSVSSYLPAPLPVMVPGWFSITFL